MPSARSGVLRTEPEVSAVPAPAAIAKVYGSPEFIARDRNPALESPTRFVATVKRDGDVII
jgi:hypothetical protein